MLGAAPADIEGSICASHASCIATVTIITDGEQRKNTRLCMFRMFFNVDCPGYKAWLLMMAAVLLLLSVGLR